MDALTQLVLLVTLAAVMLYAVYGVVRKAVRDEMASAARAVRRDPGEPQP
ncbi:MULTISPECIES: hypothetical protein [Microbacterium]|nr:MULTISPECIES: hypothetical protein [Microbacterium]MDQ1084857.1 hypothetical protein [Microbacterium sp. SORGH_AS_0344]MDQ1169863.1 hypothetical protein [Microbacterium proteolyticum]